MRSRSSGATGMSGVTTCCSARQKRSRISRDVDRSSGTDSHSRYGVLGLGCLDANFRRCGIGNWRGRRMLLATLLSLSTVSWKRSVISRVRRGMLASSQCWLRSHNGLI